MGTPQNIAGETDVSTDGSLVGAFKVGAAVVAPVVLNGVSFQSFAVPLRNTGATVGSFTIATPPAGSSNTSFGSGAAPFSSLSAPY